MQCVQCGATHERKGMYCSKSCTDKAYRERKKLKDLKLKHGNEETPEEESDLKLHIPKESGEKQRWCNFCGATIENSDKLGFCDGQHERDYWRAISLNLPLKIRIDSKTIVETRRYHKVQDIIEAMINRNRMGVTFF